MTDVERAKIVLENERKAVLKGLREQKRRAARLAEEQRLWRSEVEKLLDRGKAVGVPVVKMADALGVSRQWTSHLAWQVLRKRKC